MRVTIPPRRSGEDPQPAGSSLAAWLPRGELLPDSAWKARHRGIVTLLWIHLMGIAVFALAGQGSGTHWAAEGGLALGLAILAGLPRLPRGVRSGLVTLGLATVSAAIVDLSGGMIEAHFHLFFVIAVIALYQSSLPYLTMLAAVVVHHAVIGALDPASVYNHDAAQSAPLLWGLMHAGIVLVVSCTHMVTWRLNEQNRRDPLTSLADRALFNTKLRQLLSAGAQSGEPTTVMLVDLDDFKQVNDTYGHAVGDALLVAVTERLSVATRQADQVARLGGDEFAVLLSGIPREIAESIAERLIQALTRPFLIEGNEVFVSCSVGIASSIGGDPDELLRDADAAMYMSKRSGKAQWTHFRPQLREQMTVRARQLDLLERAVSDGDLSLCYNPLIALLSGAVVGFSAQLMWDHPSRGRLSVSEFLPLLEESGLIVDAGRDACWHACRQLAAWHQETDGAREIFVGLDVVRRQLQEPTFSGDVEAALRDTGCSPHALMLNVTEEVALSDDEAVAANLRCLSELGVWIALDGFGTGRSALESLRLRSLGAVKLDRSLTRDVSAERREWSLALGVITVVKAADVLVIAKGVENAAELDQLRYLGVDIVQHDDALDAKDASYQVATGYSAAGDDIQVSEVITLPELLHHPPSGR